MQLKKPSPMFFNPNVPIEEEIVQVAEWKTAQSKSESRSRKLIRETFYPQPKNQVGIVTEEMIEQARQYPIENLIDANRSGMAICIFHDDSRPSMSIKKYNRAYCFTCGAKADTIKIYQQLNGASFHDAVRALCN